MPTIAEEGFSNVTDVNMSTTGPQETLKPTEPANLTDLTTESNETVPANNETTTAEDSRPTTTPASNKGSN